MAEELLTYRQVADLLCVSVSTVRYYASQGVLPVVVINHKVRRIRRADLDAFIATRTQQGR